MDLYDAPICDACKPTIKLLTDKTIQHYLATDPEFEKEVERRLEILEKDDHEQRIKLLHIKSRLPFIKQ